TPDGALVPGAAVPTWVTVVGVAPTIRQANMQEAQPDSVAYLPLRSQAPGFAMLMIRAAGDAAGVTSLMREEVRALDPDLPLFGRRGLVPVAMGLTIGLDGAFGVGQLLQSLLVQTGTRDPITLVSIVLLLMVVSIGASFWPAHRATRLDPVSALRNE